MKCKEQTIEFTTRFKLRGNTPKINKINAELTTLINDGGSSEEIFDIEICINECS